MKHLITPKRILMAGLALLSLALPAGARSADSIDDDTTPPRKPYNLSYVKPVDMPDGLTHNFKFDTAKRVAQWCGFDQSHIDQAPATLNVPGSVEYDGERYAVTSVASDPSGATNATTVSLHLPDGLYYIEPYALNNYAALDSVFVGTGLIGLGSACFGTGHLPCPSPRYVNFASRVPPEELPTGSSNNHLGVTVHVPQGSLESYAPLQSYFTIIEGEDYNAVRIHLDKPGYLGTRLGETGLRYRKVNHLTVTGHMDEHDWAICMLDLPNLVSLNLAGCDVNFTTLSATITDGRKLKCLGLRHLDLPSGLREIEHDVFSGLTQLERAVFPPTLTTIGLGAFSLCPHLTTLSFGGTELRTIEESAFSGCLGATSLILPEGLEYIGSGAFSDWSRLVSIELPSTLRFCGGALPLGDSLSNIVVRSIVPPSVDYYGNTPFSGPSYAHTEGYKRVSLTVPDVARSMYGQAEGWREFSHVDTHTQRPDTAFVSRPIDFRLDAPAAYRPHLVLDPRADVKAQATVPAGASVSLSSLATNYSMDGSSYINTRRSGSLVVEGSLSSDATSIALECNDRNWEYVSFPFNVRVGDLRPRGSNVAVAVMAYDGYERSQDMTRYTSSWRQLGPDDVLQAYHGYALYTEEPVDYSSSHSLHVIDVPAYDGTTAHNVFRSDAVSVPLTLYPSEFAHNAHWNFVGNPYPCYYDISYLNTTAPIYLCGSYGQCEVYRPGIDPCILPPGQGFFVQRQADPSAVTTSEGTTLVFDPAGRQMDGKPRAAASAPRIPSGMESPFLRRTYALTLTSAADPALTDRTVIVTDREASADYEPQRDAVKFGAVSPAPAAGAARSAATAHTLGLATLSGGVSYAINERPATASEPLWLSVSAPAEGLYTLTLAEGSLIIEDLEEGTTTELTPSAPFTFRAAAGTTDGRFRVSVTPGRFTEGEDAFSIIVAQAGTLREEYHSYIGNVDYSDVKCLTITGELDASDFSFITSNLTALQELDVQGVSGPGGSDPYVRLAYHPALEYVLLPATLTALSEGAMSNCRALRAISLPAQVKTVGYNAFYNCSSLASVDLPQGLESIASMAFVNCTALTAIALPSSVTSLGTDCFRGCTALADVKLSTGLTSIPVSAFQGCTALQHIEIPEGISEIAWGAFQGCTALTDVSLPSTLGLIGSYAFADNTQAVTVRSRAVMAPFSPTDDFFRAVNASPSAPEKVTLVVPQKGLKSYLSSPAYARLGAVTTFEVMGQHAAPAELINVCGRQFTNFAPADFDDYRPRLNFYHPTAMNETYKCDDANTAHHVHTTSLTVTRNSAFHAGSVFMNLSGFAPADQDVWNTIVPHGTFTTDAAHFRFTPFRGNWSFFTPLAEQPMSGILPDDPENQWTVYTYDAAQRADGNFDQAWRRLGPTDVLHPAQGYIIRSSLSSYDRSTSFSFTPSAGFSFTGGQPVSLELAAHPAANPDNAHWNFVGNPYPCFYDLRYLDTTTPITVWNPSRNAYEAYSPIDDAYILYPAQAFFIQAHEPVAAAHTAPAQAPDSHIAALLDFDPDGIQACTCQRSEPATSSRRAAALMQRQLCNVTLTDGTDTDATRIVFNPTAQMGYEAQWDAPKFPAMTTAATQLYTLHGTTRYAINERPAADYTVELGLTSATDALLTIALAPGTPGTALLLDRLTTRLSAHPGHEAAYTFSAPAGTIEGRFSLTYQPADQPEGIAAPTAGSTTVCPHGHTYDTLGRPLNPAATDSRITIDAAGHKHIR